MIRHIPNKYNIPTMLEDFNVEFGLKYDIFYLPVDYVNSCNLGFAFINFVDPMHIVLFFDRYRGKKWKRFNSDKVTRIEDNSRFANWPMRNFKEKKNWSCISRKVP